MTAKIEMTAAEQGKTAPVLINLEQKTPFEGKAKVQLVGLPPNATAPEMEIAAADNLKRVARPQRVDGDGDGEDWTADPGTHRLTAFLETKTVWHPTGALGASGSSY